MESTNKENKKGKTITLRVPSLSGTGMQGVILILLIGVGLLQTVQLFGLNDAITAGVNKTSITAPASSGAGSSGGSALPTMVGGC